MIIESRDHLDFEKKMSQNFAREIFWFFNENQIGLVLFNFKYL